MLLQLLMYWNIKNKNTPKGEDLAIKNSQQTDYSQWLVGQAHSLTYKTELDIQMVYKCSARIHEFPKDYNQVWYIVKKTKINQLHDPQQYISFQQGFQLRGVQLLSQIWQLLSTGLSTNWINHSYHSTVPLVLSWITVIISYISRIKLTCLATV